LNELATDVRSGKITLEDIREKRVFDKIPNTTIEPFIVNGYNNILPLLVAKIIEEGNLPNVKNASQSSLARVLIIDEINRGNISRIFGELITLIEPSKRVGASEALSITLPYSKKRFSVPSNVHLIGTMNTTDRSLAGLDIALRRRFTFKEMRSRPELLDGVSVEGIDVGQLMRTMNDRIEVLLDRDHCLGHAYFMPLKIQDEALKKLGDNKGLTCADLKPIFSQQVLPLLQEYFFEDWERIAWVLNDQNKSDDNHKFILKASSNLDELFGNKVASALQNIDQRWHLNQQAFDDINSYRLILGVNQ
jgi:5-methylcytosine-specific restriction protein B